MWAGRHGAREEHYWKLFDWPAHRLLNTMGWAYTHLTKKSQYRAGSRRGLAETLMLLGEICWRPWRWLELIYSSVMGSRKSSAAMQVTLHELLLLFACVYCVFMCDFACVSMCVHVCGCVPWKLPATFDPSRASSGIQYSKRKGGNLYTHAKGNDWSVLCTSKLWAMIGQLCTSKLCWPIR